MVDHDHDGIYVSYTGQISDQVYRQLLEWQGSSGWDWIQQGASRMSVYFVLLTYSTSFDKFVDISGQSGPPEVAFEECFGVESSHMAKGRGTV